MDLKGWSGKRDLNPRLRPWQGRTLPLSYSRSAERRVTFIKKAVPCQANIHKILDIQVVKRKSATQA